MNDDVVKNGICLAINCLLIVFLKRLQLSENNSTCQDKNKNKIKLHKQNAKIMFVGSSLSYLQLSRPIAGHRSSLRLSKVHSGLGISHIFPKAVNLLLLMQNIHKSTNLIQHAATGIETL